MRSALAATSVSMICLRSPAGLPRETASLRDCTLRRKHRSRGVALSSLREASLCLAQRAPAFRRKLLVLLPLRGRFFACRCRGWPDAGPGAPAPEPACSCARDRTGRSPPGPLAVPFASLRAIDTPARLARPGPAAAGANWPPAAPADWTTPPPTCRRSCCKSRLLAKPRVTSSASTRRGGGWPKPPRGRRPISPERAGRHARSHAQAGRRAALDAPPERHGLGPLGKTRTSTTDGELVSELGEHRLAAGAARRLPRGARIGGHGARVVQQPAGGLELAGAGDHRGVVGGERHRREPHLDSPPPPPGGEPRAHLAVAGHAARGGHHQRLVARDEFVERH